MDTKRCCICYETTFTEYNCVTCQEGHVCYDCMNVIKDKQTDWVIHMSRQQLSLVLPCPCCRTTNWNYLYTHFVYDYGELPNYDGKWAKKPVFQILWRNMECYDDDDDDDVI
jgi:hypothetical protein